MKYIKKIIYFILKKDILQHFMKRENVQHSGISGVVSLVSWDVQTIGFEYNNAQGFIKLGIWAHFACMLFKSDRSPLGQADSSRPRYFRARKQNDKHEGTCYVWPNMTHFVLWMRFIRVNPVNLQKCPIACLLIMLVQIRDISTLEEPWPSNTSQHSPVASQPKNDQLILIGVASSSLVLLSPLKREPEQKHGQFSYRRKWLRT
jgi:hypothetical protein